MRRGVAWFQNAVHMFINDLGDLKIHAEEEPARRAILNAIAHQMEPFLKGGMYA